MLTMLALPKTKQGFALLRLLISYNQLHYSQSNTLTEIMTKTKITKPTVVYNVMKELLRAFSGKCILRGFSGKCMYFCEVANSSIMTSYYNMYLKLAARYH